MTKKYELTTDNAQPRLRGFATQYEIESACRKVLGWRTPTKKYDSIIDRYYRSGSMNYDKVIIYLNEKGILKNEKNN